MPTPGNHMQPLQDAIPQSLTPKLIYHQPDILELDLLTLLAAHGDMPFDDPVADSSYKHSDSIECTTNLTSVIEAHKCTCLTPLTLIVLLNQLSRVATDRTCV